MWGGRLFGKVRHLTDVRERWSSGALKFTKKDDMHVLYPTLQFVDNLITEYELKIAEKMIAEPSSLNRIKHNWSHLHMITYHSQRPNDPAECQSEHANASMF